MSVAAVQGGGGGGELQWLWVAAGGVEFVGNCMHPTAHAKLNTPN